MLFSYLNLLQSNEVAGALIKNDHFERELYNGAIDPRRRWRHTWLASIRGAISEVFGFRRSDSPTLEDVRLKLKQMLVIDQDQLTNLVTVSCTSASQTLCRDTLLAVNREAETSLNQMRRRQAEQTRDYIEQVLPAITEGDVRANMIGSHLDAKTQIAIVEFEQAHRRKRFRSTTGAGRNPLFRDRHFCCYWGLSPTRVRRGGQFPDRR